MDNADFDRFLTEIDCDDALAETRTMAETRLSRRRLLGASLAGAGVLLGRASAAGAAEGLPASDVDILNYALVLEFLQAAFYTEAERNGALKGKAAQAATVVGATERAHVKAFRKLLGSQAVKEPLFDFQGTTEQQQAFLKTAVAFEDLAVAAYKGRRRNCNRTRCLRPLSGSIPSRPGMRPGCASCLASHRPSTPSISRPHGRKSRGLSPRPSSSSRSRECKGAATRSTPVDVT